ncbi:PorP/SprF family type IX secretion system membrane protein [Parapedobacter indicus]|uniref:Type IX secretion system membrane protein, PorP/SprF family n=1 Tax=Parapedobacter indicus TaxID=1477437 RepID=A0A1I3KI98_9SPHI|nr:type IX secretion system membrane protein PorP/SprF [Parapedobacter indicus]PPL01824.1 type IX secretion system PorP/SprF family membrane protein [Parapedobacter indicus]SFI71935.1 type IX secretion system membrane protein, PorP/SprF family [Parapedobacter indicus]
MRRTFKILALLLCWNAMLPVQGQQNIQFTQYVFNSMSVNPAYAGYKEELFAQLGLRSQWVDLEGAPQTGLLSLDGLLDLYGARRHGGGIQLMADQLGPQTATSAYLNYAYRLRLDREDTQRLSFGVGAGVTQYSLDGTKIIVLDDGDQTLPTGKISNFVPDLRFGIYYHNARWYAGISLMDLLSGNSSDNLFRWDQTTTDHIRRRRHLYIIGGMLVDLNESVKLRPSLLYKDDFMGPPSLDISAMAIFGDRLWLGGGIRTGVSAFRRDYQRFTGNRLSGMNSTSFLMQIFVTERLRIGYSYDYMLSRLNGLQNGSHEVTLGVTLGRPLDRVKCYF